MNTEKPEHKTAILALTEKGAALAVKLSASMDNSAVFMPDRLRPAASDSNEKGIHYFNKWQETFAQVFRSYTELVCIMAAGIVVRSLSPLIQSKFSDPAVIVVDEKGQYVVSLLSGHIGGANRLAREVAAKLQAQPVITTATDVNGRPAVDILALNMDARIEPLKNLKLINRLLAEECRINLYSPYALAELIKEGFAWRGWPFMKPDGNSPARWAEFQEPAVIVSPQVIDGAVSGPFIQLKPRNLMIGIGCRRGVSLQEVCHAFTQVMHRFGLDERCVKAAATIDIKFEEVALQQFAAKLDIPLLTFSKAEIETLDGTYEPSEWVKNKVGVGGVCEPAAHLAARGGMTIIPKQKIGAVTISAAAEKSWWWDWDQEIRIF